MSQLSDDECRGRFPTGGKLFGFGLCRSANEVDESWVSGAANTLTRSCSGEVDVESLVVRGGAAEAMQLASKCEQLVLGRRSGLGM
jgi:hypothetical protein